MKHLPALSTLALFAAALAAAGCGQSATGCGQPTEPPAPKECTQPKPVCMTTPCNFKCVDGEWVYK